MPQSLCTLNKHSEVMNQAGVWLSPHVKPEVTSQLERRASKKIQNDARPSNGNAIVMHGSDLSNGKQAGNVSCCA